MSPAEAKQAVKAIPAWAISLAVSLLVAGVPFGLALLRMGSFEGAVSARMSALERGQSRMEISQERLETKIDAVVARGEVEALISSAVQIALADHEDEPGHSVMVERVAALTADLEAAIGRIRALEEGR